MDLNISFDNLKQVNVFIATQPLFTRGAQVFMTAEFSPGLELDKRMSSKLSRLYGVAPHVTILHVKLRAARVPCQLAGLVGPEGPTENVANEADALSLSDGNKVSWTDQIICTVDNPTVYTRTSVMLDKNPDAVGASPDQYRKHLAYKKCVHIFSSRPVYETP